MSAASSSRKAHRCPTKAATFSPAIAANPFVSFFTVARESGRVDFLWTGDQDFRVAEQVIITVT